MFLPCDVYVARASSLCASSPPLAGITETPCSLFDVSHKNLKKLWLSIRQRIQFKAASLCVKVQRSSSPALLKVTLAACLLFTFTLTLFSCSTWICLRQSTVAWSLETLYAIFPEGISTIDRTDLNVTLQLTMLNTSHNWKQW